MRRVRLPITLLLVALAPACSGPTKKAGSAPAKPVCECSARLEEGCSCRHCAMDESGMEPVSCPCAEQGDK